MIYTKYILYAFMFCCFLSAAPALHAAETENNLHLPNAVFKGSVYGFLGHEGGYVPPQIGSTIEIDFNTIAGQSNDLLRFSEGYVPLPGPLNIEAVDGGDSFEKWNSFFATAKSGKDILILNAQRKPGYGHKDFVVVWMLVKRGDDIGGVLELRGKIYPAIETADEKKSE